MTDSKRGEGIVFRKIQKVRIKRRTNFWMKTEQNRMNESITTTNMKMKEKEKIFQTALVIKIMFLQ